MNSNEAGAPEQIGLAILDVDPRLARWLIDKSNRTGIFMDIDLRGLSDDLRAAIWLGVDRANEKFRDIGRDVGPSVHVIRLFHEMRDIQGEGGDKQVSPIDLDEIWFDDDTNTA
ncbi:hypothetical protein HFO86_36500 [Rhizobium leguminosarum]|uniref:hypothetical protein n=1 Tax=Rhizobium leguminosarum TaxID=384 RepID=UPI001C93C308|nr:hypothetical protein [Rhizobium leguminosarum]MBY5475633.1 hypothetical protein [Rhizobium leguminosarum]